MHETFLPKICILYLKTAYTEVIVSEFMHSFDGYIFDLDRSISEIQMYYL